MISREAQIVVEDSKTGVRSAYVVVESALVGRKSAAGKADISISSSSVSRVHGDLFISNGKWYYRDLDSRNGSFMNGQRIESMRPVALRGGEVINIGGENGDGLIVSIVEKKDERRAINGAETKSRQLRPSEAEASYKSLNVRIIERTVKSAFKKITLLRDVAFCLRQGEMVMILGGSGAGKTTLMNAIMGYEKADGVITFGDYDIYRDYGVMKSQIGYVPQQDLLRGSDTVYDTLRNAAKMKMPAGSADGVRRKRVLSVLKLMGLQRESMSLVTKLSGGQRKRLSIAVEYIAEPSLFFLDEPDSGLDGVMARELMGQLRNIADTGKIVMVITHSPDRVPDFFDKVIIMAKHSADNIGRLAYFGSVDKAYSFFETDSLEGVVRRVNRKDEGGDGKADEYIAKYEAKR